MPVTIIPKQINLQGIKQCRSWTKAKYENVALFNEVEKVYEKMGSCSYSADMPKNINYALAAHNHPSYVYEGEKYIGGPLGPDDCLAVLNTGGKKVIAGTEDGFSSMDFSKSTLKPENIKEVLTEANQELINYAQNNVFPKVERGSISQKQVTPLLKEYLKKININLAKKYKWIYSEVKWSDYKK